MKTRLLRVTLVCISLIAIGLIFTSQSIAKLDLANVKGMWLFEDKGNTSKDSSGNGLDGKHIGSPKSVEGVFGKALEFDGKSYVEIPAHENPDVAITVTAWAKSASATWNDHGWLVEKRDAYILHPVAGSPNMAFCVVNGGAWNLPSAWDTGAVGPKDIMEWHMYTCTFDSKTGEWKIFIDGKEESKLDINKSALVVEKGPVHIGWDECCGGTRFGKGTVDEVAVFDVALGEADIQAIMKNGLDMTFLSVDSAGKLSSTWANVKTQY